MDFPSSCYLAVSFFTPPLLLNLRQFGLHCQHSAELDLLDVRSHGPLLSALVMQSALYRCTVGQVSPLKILSSDDSPSISLPGSFPLFTLQMLNILCAHSQASLPMVPPWDLTDSRGPRPDLSSGLQLYIYLLPT